MDLIDRNDLLRHLDECIAEGDAQTPITNAVLTAIKCAVEQMPVVDAVDAVPVRHGHWTEEGDCSECGMPIPTDDRVDYIRRDEVAYCCYCGAKMDEEEEE